MSIPRAVAVVLVGPRVLVIKRFVRHQPSEPRSTCEDAPPCPGHHYAVLPGGHVEEGETAAMAAVRELTEETTLEARVHRLLWTGWHDDRRASYFLMGDVKGVPARSGPETEADSPDDSSELVWALPEDFGSLNLRPTDVRQALVSLLRSR